MGPPSAEERGGPARARVADPDLVVRQDRRGQPAGRHVLEREGLVARLQRPAAHRALEADVDVVPDVAVRVAHDLARRVRVDADQPPHGDDQAGLLAHLAADRVRHRLADLDRAAGQPPLSSVGALLEQEAAAAVEDDGGHAGADPQRAVVLTLERHPPLNLPHAPRVRNVYEPAAAKNRWKSAHARGGAAATPPLSSTCALGFLPTSAVPIPGVERTNWTARCASVASPGTLAATIARTFFASWPSRIHADAIT